MKVSVNTQDPRSVRADLLAIPMMEATKSGAKLPTRLRALDRALGGVIRAALDSGDFRGRSNQTALLYPTTQASASRVLLLGLGAEDKLDAETLRKAAGRAVSTARTRRARSVAFAVPGLRRVGAAAGVQALAEGAVLAGYRFDTYKKAPAEGRADVRSVRLLFDRLADRAAVRKAAAAGVVLAECQNVARQLSNEPANELPPAALATEARKVAREVGLRCRVLGVPELRKRKMGAILAVGQGSANPPRLIVLEHAPSGARRTKSTKSTKKKGARDSGPPTICIVGKGITFDTGGISIKPAAGMPDMKHDMSGGAAVVGIMRAVALLDLPLHVIGVIAAAENMPGGNAYRPSDVVRSMSGRTIEILNTDAEGRVVLADALHYANTEFKPRAMLDLATLTGACIVALGPWATGLFGTDEELVERVRKAGEVSGERAWPMPLFDEHREAMKGVSADLRNTGGRDGGASTAAGFLSAFVGKTPWVHLDIAATADTAKPSATQPVGATGVGVRLIMEVLRSW